MLENVQACAEDSQLLFLIVCQPWICLLAEKTCKKCNKSFNPNVPGQKLCDPCARILALTPPPPGAFSNQFDIVAFLVFYGHDVMLWPNTVHALFFTTFHLLIVKPQPKKSKEISVDLTIHALMLRQICDITTNPPSASNPHTIVLVTGTFLV